MMRLCLILQALFAANGLFDVQVIPIDDPAAQCFAAPISVAGGSGLAVLDGHRLRLFASADMGDELEIVLPAGVSALDLTDLDQDGYGDLVAVRGKRILHYDLAQGQDVAPKELLALETQYAFASEKPFLQILVARRDAEALLVLPCEETLELWGLDGSLVEKTPFGMNAPRDVTYGRPLVVRAVDPPQAGPPASLELRVSRTVAFKPHLPESWLPLDMEGPLRRMAGSRQAHEAAKLAPEAWPWFPLRRDGGRLERVRYALDGEASLVRIQRPAGPEAAGGELRIGPARRYPGTILAQDDRGPDFDGDGYIDLLLWKSKRASPTIGALTRAVMEGHWPVRITAHLFVPEKGRFEPRPMGATTVNAPIGWYLSPPGRPPLRHLVLRDFDGNGQCDLALSDAPKQFSVWLTSMESGFGDAPVFRHRFPEALREVALKAALDGHGRTTIVLRGETQFFVLRAPEPSPLSREKPVLPEQS